MSGSRNVTNQSLEQKLIQDLRKLQAEFIQFKNKQAIGADSVKSIILTDEDGSQVGMGSIPDGSGFGFFVLDSSANILQKTIGGKTYYYDDNGVLMVTVDENGFIMSDGANDRFLFGKSVGGF